MPKLVLDKPTKKLNLVVDETVESPGPKLVLDKPGEISQFHPMDAAVADLKRKGALAAKGFTPPMLRKFLPEQIRNIEPFYSKSRGVGENLTMHGADIIRDIGSIVAIEGLTGGIAPAAEARVAQLGLKSGALKNVAQGVARYAPEFIKGGIFGAARAQEPKTIGKEALASAAFFTAVPAVLRAGPKVAKAAFSVLPKPFQKKIKDTASEIGHSLGLAIKQSSKAYKLVRSRYQDIWKDKIKSAEFIRGLKKQITPQEDELLPFIREKAIPMGMKIDDITKAKLEPIANEIGNYLDDAHNFIVENYGKDVGFIKDYVPHMWDIPRAKQKDVVNWFITRNPNLNKRLIPTIKEGMEKFGLKPKYKKITDILKVYDEFKIKTVANVKFVDDLMKMQDELGVKLVQRADKAPADWMSINHPVLNKGVFRGATEKGKIPIIEKIGVKVHPEIADSIKTVLGKGWDKQTTSELLGGIMRGVNTANAFGKFANLTLSLFHHVALGEAAISTGIGGRTAKLLNPVRVWKAIKTGNYGAFRDLPLTKDAVTHGLQIGALSDVHRSLIEKSLLGIENNLKQGNVLKRVMGKAVVPVRKAVEFWNKSLWDYYHTEMKLMAYEKLALDGMKKYPKLPPEAIKKEVSQLVNDTFGGQAWDLLLKSPKWQQSMHLLLLSPDWTLSTIRQALSPTGVGAVSPITSALRKDMGVDFWKRAIVYFYGGMNLMNHAMTKSYQGVGRYMWENPPGAKTKVFIGKNPDGSEAYLRFGKQFRELPEFFEKPLRKLRGKVSPVLNASLSQIFPHEYFQKDIKETKGIANIKARGKELRKFAMPYSIQNMINQPLTPQSFLRFAMPISKGMTYYKAKKLYKDAMEKGDEAAIQKLSPHVLRNNLNPLEIAKAAEQEIKTDKTIERKKTLRPIIQHLLNMPMEQRKEYIESLKKDKVIKPEDMRHLINIISGQGKIDKLREQLNIQ